MDKRSLVSNPLPKKIYVTMIGSAPMASIDALMLSLERFKGILSSDSAKDQFETQVRSVKTSLREVNQFIENVYAEKNPKHSVSMPGRTLIVEIDLTKDKFLSYIENGEVDEILTKVSVVGTMPAKRAPNQNTREYTAFPVRYDKGRFIKFSI